MTHKNEPVDINLVLSIRCIRDIRSIVVLISRYGLPNKPQCHLLPCAKGPCKKSKLKLFQLTLLDSDPEANSN